MAPLSEMIEKYMVPWLQRDWPVDWPQVFGREAELIVEIGFGNGRFLADMAAARSDVCFVGIERAWGSIRRLLNRIEARELKNVRAIEGDAAFLLQHVFAPHALGEVWINFSDPWPKERHRNRRLIRDAFVATLGERLQPGGEVTIATDHAGYASWIADVLARQSLLQSVYETPFVRELPGRVPTKYEQRALDAGVPIHYFVWRREVASSGVETRIQKVGDMPNVILEGEYKRGDIQAVVARMAGRMWRETHRDRAVVIKAMETYRQLDDGHGLISAMVREGELAQYFGISIAFRRRDQLLIKLAAMGQPRPTWGVKRAVMKVVDAILEARPELRIASRTVGSWGDG